jgi:uncharacterized protein (TIGR03083 family)
MTDPLPTGGKVAARLVRADAARLAGVEYQRFAGLLASLSDEDWSRSTACEPWDVRLLVAHVLGATEANASAREMLRQLRHGRRGLVLDVDPVSAVQVEARRDLSPDVLRRRFAQAAPRAVTRRRWWSRWAGSVPLRVGVPVHETWRLRYLMDVVYTRDVWMHRMDVCRATGRQPELSAAHDGRVVEDVVADWASRHGRPFDLVLTGVAGGHYRQEHGGPSITCDAVDFCRVLSGRGTGGGLLGTPVPF